MRACGSERATDAAISSPANASFSSVLRNPVLAGRIAGCCMLEVIIPMYVAL